MSADPATVMPTDTAAPGEASIDADLLAAAEALADGTWPPSGLPASARSACLSELQIIHSVQRVHQAVSCDAEPADDGPWPADSSASLGEALSRALPVSERPDLSTARPWGPLFVLEQVGSGSFGAVHRAWDPTLDREVALKIVRLPDAGARASTAVREGKLLASVRHDNVITVYGAAQIDGEVGIWMEFVRGRTLEQIVREDGPMSAQEATVVAESLCSALAAVHQRGLLHRDIKPANVMRAEGGRYVLIDFGTGAEIDEVSGGARRVVGTPLYMAPEVLNGAPATVRSDIYSLGVLLFFLVTGSFPLYGRTIDEVRDAHRLDKRIALAQVRPGLPVGFNRGVDAATAHSPANRLASVDLLPAALGGQAPARADRGSFAAAAWVALWLATGLMALTALGFISTVAYRAGAPGRDSVAQWPVWGLRSLVAPTVLTVLYLTAVLITRVIFGAGLWLLTRPSPDRVRRHALEEMSGWLFGMMSRPAGLQLLLLAQTLGFACLLLRFSRLLDAVGEFMTQVPAAELTALRPGNGLEHQSFRMTLTIYLVTFAYLWGRVFMSTRAQWFQGKRVISTGAVAGLAITLLLLSAPYRVIYQNTGERVIHRGEVCYLLDATNGDALLFCPLGETRVRSVPSNEIERTGHVESIFSPLDGLGAQN